MARCRQFGLLLWKNYVLQKRSKVVTLIELVFPAALALLLVFIRRISPIDYYENPFIYNEFDVDKLPLTGLPNQAMLQQLSFLFSSGSGQGHRALPITYAPNVTAVTRVMLNVANRLGYNEPGVGLQTEKEMEHFITYGTVDILAGVYFSDMVNGTFPANITYKIRMKAKRQKTRFPFDNPQTWLTEQIYPGFQIPGPRAMWSNEGGRPGYFTEGFLAVQHAVAMGLAEELSGKHVSVQLKMKRFPFPPFRDDRFLVALQQWLAMTFMISFLYPAVNLIKSIVHEKEKRLKESMKMMGLGTWLHWAAWFAKTLMLLAISSLIIVAFVSPRITKGYAILDKSNPAVVYLFLIMYCVAGISFSFMVSVFFSKANSAATAAGILWFMTYVPFFFIQPRYDNMSWFSKMAVSLISNTAMALGAQMITMHEGTGEGIQWSNIHSAINPGDSFTLASVLFMLGFDSFIYLLITWYVDAVSPGEYGVPRPWYFPFTKSYWCENSIPDDIRENFRQPKQMTDPEYFEKDPVHLYPGIQIRNLCKVYSKHKLVVNRMNLNMYEGQITVLLGHNGAGKTTTMSMLTGLIPPTFGTAYVGSHSIRDNIVAVRQSLGLCPQHDVLFDSLTVEEHLYFFAKMKGAPSHTVKPEIDHLLKALQVEDKRHSIVETLSGGMKRKLSVAIALIGGSKVVMLDEPTSGMDPAARRTTWDVLQQERNGRTILLTTHFMDEADLLGDRIAIMSHGELQCCGTPLFLKKKYGAGYHMIIVKQPQCDADHITQLIQRYLPSAELESNIGAELSYVLPHEGISKFEQLFTILENDKDLLGISSFGASITTMEEVFLRVGVCHNEGDNLKTLISNTKAGMGSRNSSSANLKKSDYLLSADNCIIDGPQASGIRMTPKLNDGLDLYCQQFWAMLVKRVLHTRRNWVLTLTQLILPIVSVSIAILVVQTMPTTDHPPPMVLDLKPFGSTDVPLSFEANATEEVSKLAKVYKNMLGISEHPFNIAAQTNLTEYLLTKMSENLPHFNLHCILGASFRRNLSSKMPILVAHFNNQPYHTPAIALAAADTAVLRFTTGNSNINLKVINHPFSPSVSDSVQDGFSANLGFLVSFNLAFGVSILASSFVIFLIKERATKARHLQFVSGVHFVTFWASTYIWDYINYMLPCAGVLFMLAVSNQDGYTDFHMQVRYMLIFMLYGWSMLPLMYCFSFLFKIPSTGFTRLTLFNIFSGVGTLLTVTILYIPELELEHWARFYDWLFLILPNYCLGWAFSDLYKNYQIVKMCANPMVKPFCDLSKVTTDCGGFKCPEFQDNFLAWDSPGVGRMVVFLTLQGFAYFAIIVGIETHFFRNCIRSFRRLITCVYCSYSRKVYVKLSQEPPALVSDQDVDAVIGNGYRSVGDDHLVDDDDVAFERERIENVPLSRLLASDNLILRDISKYYGDFLAVDHISAGIPRGECFGLLGINGAGKTTTFKMLTGDVSISDGDAFVEGYSVTKHIKQVQQRIGYCPQFDAVIEQMTGRETLTMFARLRGVHEKQITKLIDQLGDDLLLTDHIDKLAGDYSGGNKRKLSTAVALVGNPPIILLDEPTTGMDPLARRLLWDAISHVRDQGHSIVLTSHSMEECDVLCTRLAIMVNGQFRCLGSPQHLKNKFGQGYTLIAKVRSPDDSNMGKNSVDAITLRLRSFIETSFPGSVLKDLHHGMIHYHIQNPKLRWATIFGTMEKAKEEYSIEDYSVSQTTLEQVFLNFARCQRPSDNL